MVRARDVRSSSQTLADGLVSPFCAFPAEPVAIVTAPSALSAARTAQTGAESSEAKAKAGDGEAAVSGDRQRDPSKAVCRYCGGPLFRGKCFVQHPREHAAAQPRRGGTE